MKTLYTSLLVILIGAAATAQSYIPFPEHDSAFWVYPHGCNTAYKYDEVKFLRGDTMMNGILYKKVLEKTYEVQYIPFSSPIVSVTGESLIGYFRQDVAARTGFFRRLQDSTDRQIFDFSKQVGDTVRFVTYKPADSGTYEMVRVVQSIDSIAFGTGFRRRFTYLNQNVDFGFHYSQTQTSIAYEGIGDDFGLHYNTQNAFNARMQTCLFYGFRLFCESSQSLNLGFNGVFNCDSLSRVAGLKDEKIENKISFYPNFVSPNQTVRVINADGPLNLRVLLPDGRLVDELVVIEEWNAPKKAGIYLLQFSDRSGKVFKTEKLVVQ